VQWRNQSRRSSTRRIVVSTITLDGATHFAIINGKSSVKASNSASRSALKFTRSWSTNRGRRVILTRNNEEIVGAAAAQIDFPRAFACRELTRWSFTQRANLARYSICEWSERVRATWRQSREGSGRAQRELRDTKAGANPAA